MALLQDIIPEGALWSDYFCQSDTESVKEDEGEWEIVGKPKQEYKAPPKWCRDGNACEWRNCKFRHERCTHYDNWIKRGKKGHNCRSNNNNRPTEGGCLYDHRDVTKLKMFVEKVPCASEEDIWNHFFDKKLDAVNGDIYDVTKMARLDKALLVRSLLAEKIPFEDYETWMKICF